MSNDVQVAKIAATEIPRSGTTQFPGKNLREKMDYVFGSISPRGGGLPATRMPSSSCDMDSPEHTQRDTTATTESDNNISSCSTLDIVNKVEQLSVQQLENRVRELTQRLQQAERQLSESNGEREMCLKRLEVVSQAHECRITEMHCVIAELSKKLRCKQEHIILEEQEPEGSELSFQEGSVYNSELNLTNPDAECQTEPLEDLEGACSAPSVDNFNPKTARDIGRKGQVETLQEEVLHLRAQIALLQSEIATKESSVVEEQTKVSFFDCEVEANDSGHRLNDLNAGISLTSPQKRVPAVPKMAERVKLQCASKIETTEDDFNDQLSSLSSENINVVGHLEQELKEKNMLTECKDPLYLSEQVARLQRRVEQLELRNTTLTLTLNESKEHTEHMYLLCGKYESNAVALQLALNCSDRAIEAYDVMLALLESKLALLVDKSAAAEESRRSVVAVARHLLTRLDREDGCDNSLGPWQHNINLGAEEDTEPVAPWSPEDDKQLRYYVSKLKGRRSSVQNTVVCLESPFSNLYEKKRMALEKEHEQGNKKYPSDLETAVIMQELLDIQDENQELRAKIDTAEQECRNANERVLVLHDALTQLQANSRFSYSESEHAALTEQQLVEALIREAELKNRIQDLLANVAATKNTIEKLQNNAREQEQSNQ
ncbi:hypothetical protein KR018_009069 [Drosophila ironensis]|nr:hypothetical protein KR018_009069 [Drosophila ironensis]